MTNEQPTNATELEAQRAYETNRMGMYLFLVTLGVLFISSLVGYFVIWYRSTAWGHPIGQSLPGALWGSTAILMACSFAHHRALVSARADRKPDLTRWLGLTLLLGAAFLACQGYSWWVLIESHLSPQTRNLYAFSFYMLTTLHALHVVGGLTGLAVVWYRARHGAYNATSHAAVWRSTAYWHFLDAVWLVLFGTLMMTVR